MFLWLSHHHNRLRLYRWSVTFGGFAVVQLLVQLLNAGAGFLLVRTLEKPDYAWFTIASSMSAALAVLADSGIVSAVTSIGGTVWQDKSSLKGLVQAAMRLRMKLAVLNSIIVACISLWLLQRNGAGLLSALGLTALVIAPIWQISTTAVYSVVNRLESRTRQLQVADLAPAFIRAAMTAALALLDGLTPMTALMAVLAAHLTQCFIVRRQVLPSLITVQSSKMDEHTASVWKIVHRLLPNSIFFCVQGQLTTWLISIFATTSEVSDLGALNRLAVIFAVLAGPLGQFVFPAFARATSSRRMWGIVLGLVAGVSAFSVGLLALACWHGEWFLWLLGEKYAHLQRELMFVLAGMSLTSLSGFLWGLNVARGWINLAWLNIPFSIVTQSVGAFLIPLDNVIGMAWLIIATGMIQCVHALVTCLVGLSHASRKLSSPPVCWKQ